MKQNSEDIVQKITSISRRISLFIFISVLLSALIGGVMIYLDLRWAWLNMIGKSLLIFLFIALSVRFTASGVLFIFRYPKLAYAWFRGTFLNRSDRLWEQLSNDEKFFVYLNSIAPLIVILLGIVILILHYFSK
ncbi:MAG: hypothetical protein H7Y59_11065 [Anaerolineales bacterium]|nr:hypothetical protein [Anaerolineales bacterium]